jgi:hypothetical protein
MPSNENGIDALAEGACRVMVTRTACELPRRISASSAKIRGCADGRFSGCAT